MRDSFIKVTGESHEIERFEEFIAGAIRHLDRYNKLTEADVENIFFQKAPPSKNLNESDIIIFGTSGKPVRARTQSQRKMVKSFSENDLVFAVGPAGTGKTYLAISLAVRALKNQEVKRIILSRPAVEAGERLGFLPGDIKDKLDPYLQALYDALRDMIPGKKLNDYMEQGIIQIAPLAYMRGRTLSNAVVILDEAQNATKVQMKMFLTRMGEYSKFIVTGDITQIDLPSENQSGLLASTKILKDIKGIAFQYFSKKDIVRHKLVQSVVTAFEESK